MKKKRKENNNNKKYIGLEREIVVVVIFVVPAFKLYPEELVVTSYVTAAVEITVIVCPATPSSKSWSV